MFNWVNVLFDLRHRKRFTISRALWDDGPTELVAVGVDEWNKLLDVVERAQSLHAGLTCANDPMDVDERIERLGATLDVFAQTVAPPVRPASWNA